MRSNLTLTCMVLVFRAFAQPVDQPDSAQSIHARLPLKKAITAPAILIVTGLVAMTDNEVFDKWEVKEARDDVFPTFHTSVDDYLQYAPLVAVPALKGFGVQSDHDWANLALLTIKSEALMVAIVVPLKHFTNVMRPDSGSHSFPSGHTAQAFVGATILHREFGRDHPMISVVGYLTASAVGVLRIMNDRHWVSDVLVGAGIGMLSTNLVYWSHRPVQHRRMNNAVSRLRVSPYWSNQNAGLNVAIRMP